MGSCSAADSTGKVVQRIVSQNVLGLLLNLSALVGRQQLRADRGIHDVVQDGANLLIEAGTQVGDHPTNHRLGQADIDVVVGKVVPAKGTPASASSDISPVPTTSPRQLFATSIRIWVRSRACAFS
mgnify:CR=1 FL=1